MRIARKLTLLAMLAIAAAALAAPSAFAQTSTEPEAHNQTPRLIVQQEVHNAVDAACPAVAPSPPAVPPALPPLVATGGCRTHVASVGTVPLTGHDVLGNEGVVFNCTVEFNLRIDAAGEGYITHHEYTGPAGVCVTKPCGQVAPPSTEGRVWSFFTFESEVAGSADRERAIMLFCIEPITGGASGHCEITVPFGQPTTHRYRFNATDVACHSASSARNELTGVFDVEAVSGVSGENLAQQNIEIRHT
jgi:hypothetical protein